MAGLVQVMRENESASDESDEGDAQQIMQLESKSEPPKARQLQNGPVAIFVWDNYNDFMMAIVRFISIRI